MPFSPEQEQAINQRDKNIIVSAGAGSGKTAVLTERISQILLSGHTLDELLVLTFTNKAAAEMKERVRKKILANNNLLIHKDKVDSANITTFDAYCQFIVNKYGYLLNISDINVADNVYLEIKANKILDEIVLDHFKNDKENIKMYFDLFPDKNDSGLKAIILSMYKKIDIIIDKESFYNTYFDKYYGKEFINNSINEYFNSIKKALDKALLYKDELIKLLEEEKEYTYSKDLVDVSSEELYDFIINLYEFIESKYSLDDLKVFFSDFAIPRISQKNKNDLDLKEIRTRLSSLRGNLKDLLDDVIPTIISKDDLVLELDENKKLVKFLLGIIKEFDDKFYEFKKENSLYSFMDIQKIAIELLKIESARNEIKDSLYEILIDEYQDTSYIQEYFINLISKNNVYVVGDIKQGIYRFRNAEPELFNDKYNTYSVINKYNNNSKGMRIDLTKNFRSRKEVLTNINLIFDKLMTLEYGSAAFKESHEMVYGLTDYNNQSLKDYNYNMQILSYSTEKEDDDSEGINATTQEIEANIIAKDIKEKMNNNFKVFDSDSKTLRDAKYSDFAILIDRGTSFEIIKKILESKNIPVSIEADLKLNEDNITLILSSLVNLVVLTKNHTFNSNYYHYFMSIARSYLFMMDDAKIYDIVMSARDGYGFKNEEPKSNIISDKIKMIASHLNEFSNSDIFTMLIDEFEVIKKLPLVGNTQSKLIIIDRIRNYIDSWSSFGESLDTISEYIKEMLNDDNNKYSIDTTGSDAVRIMTIHKSKGLEFPICYFPMLDKKFMEAVKESVGLNVRYGMYFSKESIIRALAKNKERSLDLSERIRLFYVALTRAREQMILISPNLKKEINYVDEIRSFNDMLNYVKDDLNNYIVNIDLSTYEIDDAYQRRKKLKDIKYHEKPIYNNISYLSDIISQNRISKEVIEVLSDREQENLDLGLKYHRYMELLDFNNIDTSNIKEPNIKADIELVLNNDIMKDLSKAKTYHEHEFIFLDKKTNETFHGIIDLLAVYDDHIDIIDYKLFHIDDLAYDRQLSIYKRYVESISNLPIRCYLLSLAHNKVREVKI